MSIINIGIIISPLSSTFVSEFDVYFVIWFSLGGNCRTCLVVTVSSQSSLISETLSSLQFASRAMAVPSRPIYTSQLHYTPEQVYTLLPRSIFILKHILSEYTKHFNKCAYSLPRCITFLHVTHLN